MEFWSEIGAGDGSVDYALTAARVVSASGGSALKVQWLHPKDIFTRSAPRYDNTSGEWATQFAGYEGSRNIYPYGMWEPVIDQCRALDLEFIPAVFSKQAVTVASEMSLPHVKVASGDITHFSLIDQIGREGFPRVTISTGASTPAEIERAVEWLRAAGWSGELTLLACHLQYPSRVVNAHLGRIIALRDLFPRDVRIGYSDHTPGIDTIPVALSFGAQVVEKHFSLHPKSGGGDHDFAIGPEELAAAVQLSQYLLEMIGNVEIEVSPGEAAAREGARRSLFAVRDLVAGEQLTADDVVALRPVTEGAFEAWEVGDLIGQRVAVGISKGSPVLRRSVGAVSASLTVS